MNRQRRKEIRDIANQLEMLMARIEAVKEEEEEAFENLPESIQYSERGEQMEECAMSLDEAVNDIDLIKDTLLEIAE